ncbi:hypothetical protein RDI58_024802 [Solanum bulbocastanum]|uniref:Uncharacterized protein n=1 Tax=Solanum bulbocastanum TaxID=147425 RepID=A0AAN8T1X4_SOLBU
MKLKLQLSIKSTMVSQTTFAQTSSSIQVVSSQSFLGFSYRSKKPQSSSLDGSIPCPSSTHDEYRLWIQCDTITLSWINDTLSPPVLDSLLNYACDTSKQTWHILAALYLDQGLPPPYRTFVSGLNATGTLLSFLALHPLLLTEEAHINVTDNEDSISHTALVASAQAPPLSQPPSSNSSHANQYPRGSHNGCGRDRLGRGKGQNQCSSRFNFSPHWAGFQPYFLPSSSGDGILGRPPFTLTKQCQIFFHFNHTALECRNCFNHSYSPNLLPVIFSYEFGGGTTINMIS